MKLRPIYITDVNIYTESEIVFGGSIFLENGLITNIYVKGKHPKSLPRNTQIIQGKGLNVIPGFIDGHIHGAAGADVMDASFSALDRITSTLPREGTTSFLATTITHSSKRISKALQTVAAYRDSPGHAEVIGVHLEGPFIEASKAGAQPIQYIKKPHVQLFNEWQQIANNQIKIITLAPEHDRDGTFIQKISNQGVIVSAGHSAVTFEGMKAAINHGVSHVTHLCNGMSGIHHRDIGLVGAALMFENLFSELIVDGIHVSPEMVQLIYKNVGSKRLMLITDGIRAKYLQQGTYDLAGQMLTLSNERATLKDGTLAGSIIKMDEAAQQMITITGASLTEIIQMTSTNLAKQLGIFSEKGSISVGKDADILLVDDSLRLKLTICRGVIAHREEN
ncbi:MAG TPA: N-acetylglucosamine-6-phosphate deacetylase [Virgibacillus sp.]|nr:N-acetylglucosamine-6-phosphate deacetylase [Virgibacillus sp.]